MTFPSEKLLDLFTNYCSAMHPYLRTTSAENPPMSGSEKDQVRMFLESNGCSRVVTTLKLPFEIHLYFFFFNETTV